MMRARRLTILLSLLGPALLAAPREAIIAWKPLPDRLRASQRTPLRPSCSIHVAPTVTRNR